VPVVLDVVEERDDQLGVEVGDVELVGCLPVRWAVNASSSRTASR